MGEGDGGVTVEAGKEEVGGMRMKMEGSDSRL
jgi:hypothetical protein